MDTVPSELALNIAAFLNPADRWRLSATNRHYRNLLPVWLRIKIYSPSSHSSLESNFYVSHAATPQQPLLHHSFKIDGDITIMTDMSCMLKYGVEYVFWTYDYERENPVFLARHGQKLLYHENPHYLYTLGLRPLEPNQTWKIVPHKGGVTRRPILIDDQDETDGSLDGEPVPNGRSICLTVGGQHSKPFRPDSSTRLYLSAHCLSSGALWYTIHNKEWCMDEEMQIIPSADYPNFQSQLLAGGSVMNDDLEETSSSTSNTGTPPEDDFDKQKSSNGLITERDLIVHAIPDILDGGYSLYSPESLKFGRAACMLHHVTIPCHYWIQEGIMMFHAFKSLHFAFGVPILEEDHVDYQASQAGPLAILLRKNSSRWWAIKHYISTAADADEGRTIKMDVFLRNSKDHEDHTVLYDKERGLVHIKVQDAIVEAGFPNIQRDENAIWEFLLCG